MAGVATCVRAQGLVASGIVSGSGSGPYTYDLVFSNGVSATQPIRAIWYAGTTNSYYLPSTPISVFAPAGWNAALSGNGTQSSIQFTVNSGTSFIAAGSSLSGFGFQANFTPSELAAAPNGGLSWANSGSFFNGLSERFTVTGPAAPEPGAPILLVCGGAGLWLASHIRANELRGRS